MDKGRGGGGVQPVDDGLPHAAGRHVLGALRGRGPAPGVPEGPQVGVQDRHLGRCLDRHAHLRHDDR